MAKSYLFSFWTVSVSFAFLAVALVGCNQKPLDMAPLKEKANVKKALPRTGPPTSAGAEKDDGAPVDKNVTSASVSGLSTHPNDSYQFRGTDRLATSKNNKVPVKWSSESGVVWKAKLPGSGSSTPIVAGKKVFVTAFSGYGVSTEDQGQADLLVHHVMCFNRRHGDCLWTRDIKGSTATQKLNENLLRHGFASSTPVTDGRMLYCFFGTSGVHAFDFDGKRKWQANVGSGQHAFGSSASLTIFKDLVIVNASIEDKTVYAFNKTTGKAAWKIDDVFRTWTTPVIGLTKNGNPELIINQENIVRGFNAQTGEELWRCDAIEDYIISVPVCVDGVCYINAGRQKQSLAVRLGGRGDVTETHKLWQVPQGSNVSSPVYHDGRLFVVNDSGILHCLNAETGELIKRKRSKTKARVYSSPSLIGDKLLLPTMDAGVYVVSADDELKESGNNKLDGDTPFQSSLAISANRMFIRDPNYLYCLGRTPRPNTTVTHEVKKSGREVLNPLDVFDYDEKSGRHKNYLDYFKSDPDELVKFILKPYTSVITEEQQTNADKIIKENMPFFVEQKQRHQELKWKFMSDESYSEAEYRNELEQIEEVTMKHNHKVRGTIKKTFSKEQMDQHFRDVEVRKNGLPPQTDAS